MTKLGKVLFMLALLTLFCVCAFWRSLTLRFYTVDTGKLAAGSRLRVALLTDLHSCVYGENNADLLDLVTAQNPDVILLGGDIVDDVNPLENAVAFFESLRSLGIPAYYVSGNHDRWRPDYDEVRAMIEGCGVTVLEHQTVSVDTGGGRVNLCGLREYSNAKVCAEGLTIFSALPEDGFNLLLSHRPDYIDLYRKYPFDLVLCGHTHGGQVRVPFLVNGLYAPDQGWFPRYAGGEYHLDGTTLIVSRGLSYNPRLPRVFNPPEVVIVDVRGTA